MSSVAASRRRILVLIKGLGIGGAERLISDAVPVWDRDSFDYSVAYILPWKDQLAPAISAAGVDVSCVGGRRGLDPWTPRRLRKLISSSQIDVVHAHLPSAGIVARLFAGVPVVYTEHNLSDSYRQPTRSVNRLTYRRNRAVIAVSEAVADSLEPFPGPEPIVIPNGITVEPQPDAAASVREELGVDENTRLVVHVGNIRPHKGHSNLIQATTLLAENVPEALVVSIGAEKHEGDLARVTAEAERAAISSHLRFLGRRDDARRFLAGADVVVNPSDVEGLPVVLLEALSYGRPVVATDVGGVSKVVIDEETGLLVAAGEPAELAKAIERALTDSQAASWGEKGRSLVRSRHGIEQMVRSYEDVYREVIDE